MLHLSQKETVCGMESVCVAVSNGHNPNSSSQGFVFSLHPNEVSNTVALLKVYFREVLRCICFNEGCDSECVLIPYGLSSYPALALCLVFPP